MSEGKLGLCDWMVGPFNHPIPPSASLSSCSDSLGVLQVLDNCNQVSQGFQDASGMKVGSWNASGCTYIDQQNLFTFGMSCRKCSPSWLTGGCRCWRGKENPGKRGGSSYSWGESRRL